MMTGFSPRATYIDCSGFGRIMVKELKKETQSLNEEGRGATEGAEQEKGMVVLIQGHRGPDHQT